MLTTFLILLWLHLLGDYILQDDFQAANKGKYDFILLVHVLLWTGCICFGLWKFGLFAWWKLALLVIGHFFIDRWKARKADKTYSLNRDLWLDQALHVLQLVVCLI